MSRKFPILLALALGGCTEHYHVSKCQDGFDADFKCDKAVADDGVASIILNEAARTALIDIKGPGGPSHNILDGCKIVDSSHWECEAKSAIGGNPITYGVSGDQFYHSDNDPSIGYYFNEAGSRFGVLDELQANANF